MFTQLRTIAANTFTESIRQPIFVVLTLAGALLLVLNLQLSAYTFDDDTRQMISMSLNVLFLGGLFLAAVTATEVISREIRDRTVLTVVSKPVPRPVFVVGKFLGVLAAIAVAYWTLCMVLLLTIRQGVMMTASDQFDMPVIVLGVGAFVLAVGVATMGNYLYRWVFGSTLVWSLAIAMTLAAGLVLVVSRDWQLQPPWWEFVDPGLKSPGQLLRTCIGGVLVFEAVTLLTAVAVACSTRLGQAATMMICLGVFVLGLFSNQFSLLVNQALSLDPALPYFASLGAIFDAEISVVQKTVYLLAKGLYLVAPNLQLLWPGDAIATQTDFTLGYLLSATLYAAFYTGALVALAVGVFQTREVG